MTGRQHQPLILEPGSEMAVQWAVSQRPVDYDTAMRVMEDRVSSIADGKAEELIWLLEHPSLYTAGTSAKEADLLEANRLPVHWTGRGGQFTYHGPGQRVVYVMLDLKRRTGGDVRRFVGLLESVLITALAQFGIQGETRKDRVGVWVPLKEPNGMSEAKIAAIGIRVRKWVSFHGLSLNVAPDLTHFDGIVPCGIDEFGVTSLADLAVSASQEEVDMVLRRAFEASLGATVDCSPPA
ncbi:MAG: lipoyl(octanoyl) transferase LipB [Hyphomicrobiaceae bacterium TMED74]|nr:lipoate-protein ligase B [Filomicrobium sp.]RPG40571.1 MAG: lipoyl(octanoyl) transferase LipB [Hyphomicrobiaceae bacterium TMED74]